MKNFILSILSMLFIQSCLEKDDVLPKAMPYTGNQLKMNGYYHQISSYNNVVSHSHVMYINGVLINLWGSGNTIEEIDEYVRQRSQEARYKKYKYNWGVFFIDDNTIRIHQLHSDYPHREWIQEGVILNDTTFKITKSFFNGRMRETELIYHFREFSPKPDSTNVYIK